MTRSTEWLAGGWHALGDAAERRQVRLYERLQERYAKVPSWLGCVAIIPLQTILVVPVVDRYWPISSAKLPAVIALIALPLYGAALLDWRRTHRRRFEMLRAWLVAGRPAEGAVELWNDVSRAPSSAAASIVIALPFVLLGGAGIGILQERGADEIVAGEVFAVIATLWTAVIWSFVTDLLLRPVQQDAAARLPPDFVPQHRGLPFAQRVLATLLAGTVFASFVGVLIADRGDSSVTGLIGSALLAGAVALAFSLLLSAAALRSMLRPVDDLIAATKRLGTGDLATRAPLISDDEFGGLAMSFNEMAADLQRSREQLVSAREEERRRLRRDLHDGLGPTLAGVAMRLEAAQALIASDPGAATAVLAEVRADTVETIADIRRLVYALRPPQLDDLGLVGAIRERAARLAPQGVDGGLRIAVEAPSELPEFPAALEVAAYRIVEEALTNVTRHAQAHSCEVRLSLDRNLELRIRDDGSGMRNGSVAGVGLNSMRERAAELGGVCRIESLEHGGTLVIAQLPLP